jgi:ring-1,2-phenylacetyl-CoA epoxidase subunit PaaD
VVNASAVPRDQPASLDAEARIVAAWDALNAVEDPEIPAVNLVDLGIVRFVKTESDGVLQVGLSPTYTGCPATEVIRQLVERALEAAGVGRFAVSHVLSPAWTSDWITPEGRRKLAAYGIVPPVAAVSSARLLLHEDRPIACPRCNSLDTECISQFGSTPCKALHRCRRCLEPFEYFKCI